MAKYRLRRRRRCRRRSRYKYIGTFGSAANPIATFSGNGEIINVRVGETIDGKFILKSIGIESVDIGFVGFPPNKTTAFRSGNRQ